MEDQEKRAEAPAETPEEEARPKVDLSALGGSFVRGDENYEDLFMKDARQKAHDAELEALAMLALFRSDRRERNQLLANLELEQSISPRVVDRHLNRDDDNEK